MKITLQGKKPEDNLDTFPMVYEFKTNRDFKVLMFSPGHGVVVHLGGLTIYKVGEFGCIWEINAFNPRPDISVTFEAE